MKNYIVFDLEWNQSPGGRQDSIEEMPFEIIEIGAVKMDEDFRFVDEFHRLICPQVYTKLHYMISDVTHINIEELRQQGRFFPEAADEFFAWCGQDAVFCTWGSMDLTELQRNLAYYVMENPFPRPLLFYDVQKLYGLFYRNGERLSLDGAVEELELKAERPFHRALDDAWYTARVLARLSEEPGPEVFLPYQSIDYFRLPETKKEEIHMVFPGYSKYVSRIFPSKEDAMKDRSVTRISCYECGRALRAKIRWFTPNQKVYQSLACCPEHGWIRGKIRLKKVDEDQVFVIKTLKLTDDAGAELVAARREEVRKKRSERNRAKKQRLQEEKKAASPAKRFSRKNRRNRG